MLVPGGSTAANLLRPLQCRESKVCRGLQAEKAEAGLGANHASQQSDNQADKLKSLIK